MPCFHPITGWRSRKPNAAGNFPVVFDPRQGSQKQEVPCGQCIGCRLERSRQWAVRCMHEAKMWPENSFITLTYADEHLPQYGSLVKADFQKFMKRLRKHRKGKKIRYYMCGEYGEKLSRPHYHACLFNEGFDGDKQLFMQREGVELSISPTLQKLWPFGHSTIGELNFRTAAYTARYIMKKVNGDDAEDHYLRVDHRTGEVLARVEPEYTTMSRRPGIGKTFFDTYQRDMLPRDYVLVNGHKCSVPRYYSNLFELEQPEKYQEVKKERQRKAKANAHNNSDERLLVREKVTHARFNQLHRRLENET